MGTGILHGSPCIVRVGLSESIAADFHFRNLSHKAVIQILGKVPCYILRRTYRKLDGRGYTSGIRLREIFRLYERPEENYGCEKDTHRDTYYPCPVSYGPCDNMAVTSGNPVNETVYRAENGLMELSGLGFEPQKPRAEHRNESKRTYSGNYHDYADYPAELFEHHPGYSLDKCQRKEYGQHGKGGRYDRNTYFLRGMDGGFFRLFPSLQMRRYVFQHYDSIVHHHSYRYGKGGQRYDIQGVPCSIQIYERGQEGYRDCKDDDKGGPPSPEEHIHDEHHHKESNDDSLLQAVDTVDDVPGVVDHGGYLHI